MSSIDDGKQSGAESLRRARAYIDQNLAARQSVIVVHGFPSPLFWTDENPPLAEILSGRRRLGPKPIALYIGIPYCPKTSPEKCGYCLFPVEDFTGNHVVEEYFHYLQREGRLFHSAMEGDTPSEIFFGGGTSNLYKADKYPALMDMVREIFPTIPAEVPVTLEGLPALFTREKIQKIKQAGMNRVSMGAQQMNDELNRLSGRRQTAQHVIQTIDWCHELGLGCNVDLIFGWPQQTVSTMVKDLEMLIGTGVDDITHYELHLGGPTDFAINRRDELPTTLQNLELYRVSRDLLRSHGFRQVTAYNWRRETHASLFEEGVCRSFDSSDMWGWGYGAFSWFHRADASHPGWLLKNATSVKSYKAAIDAGQFPVQHGYQTEPIDERLALLMRNLHGMEVDRAAYRSAFGNDVVDEFAAIWQAVEERGFVEIDEQKIRVVGDGVFYTPMIQSMLGLERYVVLRSIVLKQRKKLLQIGELLGGGN